MSTYKSYKLRRLIVALIISAAVVGYGVITEINNQPKKVIQETGQIEPGVNKDSLLATNALKTLEVKGRAPKTGYKRAQFGSGWRKTGDCTTREIILARDMTNTVIKNCKVYSGELDDPYTGKKMIFQRGPQTSSEIQIDHVVALSDAWQKGAQQLGFVERENLANDPLELLAVEGKANQIKSDGDAATWMPSNKSYHCRYVARQIAVKSKYRLWVTAAEKNSIEWTLSFCPQQQLPIFSQ